MYMVRRADYALRPENMLGMVTYAISESASAVDHFKCWHRRKSAIRYIADLCSRTNQDKGLYSVVTMESK